MGHFDWDPDELLNFDYGKSVPDRSSAEKEVKQAADGYRNNQQRGRNQVDDAQLYNALRKESEEQRIREQIDARMRAQRDEQIRARQDAREREEREIKQAQLRAYQESERRAQERARAERAAQQEAYEKAQRQAQYEAQQRAQREAQMRAQYEAQQRAQYEAQMRAQQEAQQRAQYEAQMRAQQEAQQRAQYEAQMRAQQERARQEAQIRAQQEAEQRVQVEQQRMQAEQPVNNEAELLAQQEAEAKKRAQIEAYERYRAQSRNDGAQISSNAAMSSSARLQSRKAASKAYRKSNTLYKVTKFVSVLYLIFAVVFALSMTIMNVLPIKYLIPMWILLAVLSFVIIKQLRAEHVKKWARTAALIFSIVMLFVYGTGTAYALGTLSFLSTTSVKNEKKVNRITATPFNVVMTGLDVRGKIDEQGRSDVNMIVTVNPKTETILLTSIPRDYEIRMPDKGYATDKLTHTGFYSVDTTIQSEEDLLDIVANYYVKVNFSTVVNFINAIGGIEVYSEYDFNPEKLKSFHVSKGMNYMTGSQALAFARERHAFVEGDNQRIKNQQAVFEALIKKATSSRTVAISYGQILSKLKDYFEMSFSSREIRELMKYQIAAGPDWKIYKNTLVGTGATKPTYTGGSQPLYVMEQDPTSVANAKKLISAVMDGKELTEDENGVVSVVDDDEDDTDSEE